MRTVAVVSSLTLKPNLPRSVGLFKSSTRSLHGRSVGRSVARSTLPRAMIVSTPRSRMSFKRCYVSWQWNRGGAEGAAATAEPQLLHRPATCHPRTDTLTRSKLLPPSLFPFYSRKFTHFHSDIALLFPFADFRGQNCGGRSRLVNTECTFNSGQSR